MLFPLTMIAWLASLTGEAFGSPVMVTRMVVQEEIVLRVPVIRPPLVQRVRWVERKGPKCIDSTQVRAAALSGEQSVDFLLGNRSRVRAELGDSCPTLDFYGSFYIEPRDQRICARREAIKSRMGASCRIARFHRLEPRLP